ncbi:a8941fea-77c3-45e5-a276-955ba504fbd3 [Thermothielavioides terrestris]|uniref:RNA-dependent RNA polymerase n=2 Tax=Thermothielavioides terrestris TaxID=2587410 RepID=G2RGB9_THETT|nr:uncharacterized protein THITE_2147717 [Thermothielavioides terrestris NRRL 8126]AEO71004.1 hypothetical protein THITE_2147717 [Thermothielavioides terrestris NRRL 8126]SPQ20670.1 a8941fea-77c3-45e5-a276-955ba504fbd3 [Thermothielavioides terrestris]
MEVFLRNLPPHLTEGALLGQLQPFMEKLSIADYVAEKPRNKPTGRITFLREADGKRFLQHHGEVPLPQTPFAPPRGRQHGHPPTQARLSIMGKNVFCKLSNRKPDGLTLRSIEHEASQRGQAEPPPEPTTRTLAATELNCGYYDFDKDARLTFTAEWTARERCHVKFAKRNLLIGMTGRRVQLRIPFQSIIELVWWEDGSAAVTLSWPPTILTWEPPDDKLTRLLSMLSVTERDRLMLANPRQRLDAIDSQHRPVSAFCLVYHFRVPNPVTRHAISDFQSEMYKMKQKALFPVTHYRLGFRHAAAPGFADAAASMRNQLANYNRDGSLPFGLLFLLQALVANGYLHPATVSALARKLVALFAAAKPAWRSQPPVSVDAFKQLFQWIDYPTPPPNGDPNMFSVDGIMEYLQGAERLVREGSATRAAIFDDAPIRARIFRATVTPTRITLHGPELEPMNRVLRKFSDHSYFIRAQFCDENGQDLFFNAKVSLDAVFDRFKSVLTDGIQVAGRVYKLLGFSHSSLRAHSAWLSAPFIHEGRVQIPDLIITGLGDFNRIQSPARRAARIGQAFSETPYAVDLDENMIQVLEVPDVERNGRVFSDGVGTISAGAADAVYNVIPKSKGYPTCFQIRWAGAKGMLSLDPRLEGNKICIRPSMVKFESNDRQLEICDMASRPIPMVLNHQLIKILEDMGAPDKWFLELQNRELQRLRAVTATVCNTASFVRAKKIGQSIQLHKLLLQTEAMGLDYWQDDFLRTAVEAIVLNELRLLKHKARIPVPKGITLFGIMDETGFLDEGEVYVTYDAEDRYCQPPGPGPVIVARSPALHPGDIQVAYNRIPPDGHPLIQQRNCLIFSSWGDRDLPSQLSGGDLDGDQFHVIWDPQVVASVITFEPAKYDRVSPLELDRPVVSADIAAFFVDFMRTDHLGVIATRHKILADQREGGTLDQDCVRLAELHSRAVDFSKTGRAVERWELPQSLKWRPDFLSRGPEIKIHDISAIELDQYAASRGDEDVDDVNDEGPQHRYYRSEKILGKLYRAVDERKIWAEDIRMAITSRGSSSFWDQFLAVIQERVRAIGPVEWQRRSAEAQRIRHAYEDAVHGVMIDCAEHPHQPLREFEVFIGFILHKTEGQARRQRDRSVKIKDEFEYITSWITREMRNPSKVSGRHAGELDALELCLACLHIGCRTGPREKRAWHRSSALDLESFKIVAAAALVRELSILETRGRGGQTYAYGGSGNVGFGG